MTEIKVPEAVSHPRGMVHITGTYENWEAARAVIPIIRSLTLPALSPSLISMRMKVDSCKVTQVGAAGAAAIPHTALLEQMNVHAGRRVSACGHWSALILIRKEYQTFFPFTWEGQQHTFIVLSHGYINFLFSQGIWRGLNQVTNGLGS